MDAFEVDALAAEQGTDGVDYREFLREASLSVGLYTLPASSEDPQTPHAEDEMYHVVSGRATLRVNGKERPVSAGSVVFVPRGADHAFVDIEETLRALVVFAPAEGTLE